MADFPLIGGGSKSVSVGYDASNTRGTAVTSSATADTVGSWVELQSAASNTFQSDRVTVVVTTLPATYADLLINISIGAAASETTIIPNLFCSIGSTFGLAVYIFEFPISIPSGQRIAANCQSSGSSQTCYVNLIRNAGVNQSLSKISAIGSNTAGTSGVTVARSSANTFGSWVEITSSTATALKGFVVAGHRAADSWSNGKITYEVGVGGAGSEEIIYQGFISMTNSNEGGANLSSPFVPVQVAVGQRLAIRAKSDDADPDFDFDYILYGVS